MSTEEPDAGKKISTQHPSSISSKAGETPEVGIGLIVLGVLCLVVGVGIGLIFSVK